MASDMHLSEKEEKNAQAKKRLSTGMLGIVELKASWQRTWATVSLLQFSEGEYEGDEIMVEKLFTLRSRVSAVQCFALESVVSRSHCL